MDLHEHNSLDLAKLIQQGEISAEEALLYYQRRLQQLNPLLNAVVVTRFEEALQRAKEADHARNRGENWGPLHGVPITVKETFEIKGWPTTAGIPDLKGYISSTTAPAVQRLLDAGAIIFGKTNVPAFASDLQTYNSIYGITHNPWNTEYTPGGSSGGAATAVAARLTPLELGSDLGGSIRIPAAFCGVYGLKPSWGLIPTLGHIPGLPGTLIQRDMLSMGPIGRTVEDLQLALSVLAGPDEADSIAWQLQLPPSRHQHPQQFRVAAWLNDSRCPIDSRIESALQTLITSLRQDGVHISDPARPKGLDLNKSHQIFYSLLSGSMGSELPPSLYEKLTAVAAQSTQGDTSYRTRFACGATQSHAAWLRSHEQRLRLRKVWHRFFQDYDILLCPVVQTPAFPHMQSQAPEQRLLNINGQDQPYMDIMVWISLASVAYLPAVTVPIGLTTEGLPLAVQVIGPYLEDHTILAFAKHIERVVGPMPIPALAHTS